MKKVGRPRKDTVHVSLRVERDILKQLRVRALDINISLQQWVMQAIAEKIVRENAAN